MTISVLRPGLLTTVQDHGRHGFQHLGVIPGGAMDPVSLSLANALVGNTADAAALEITILGPELVFAEDTLVALCGAEFHGALPRHRPVLVPAGGKLSIGRAQRGARAYLAVAGGISVEPALGSRSTYLPGRFGGYQGRALRRGDVLTLREDASMLSRQRFARLARKKGSSVQWRSPSPTLPEHEPVLVHAMPAQDYESFDSASQRAFFDSVWKIAPESNRMGFRFTGPSLARPQGDEILSGPTCLGSVQVPPSGAPIALMADHQTTGGYPRIAEIASADVPRLAQLAPGGTVHFARCTLETSVELRLDARRRLDAVLQGIAWELRG
ncbi:MAG: biotin-dependent carboxyltransferase family protein [Betaproteobacteria bacterium]|nr:biotin-dependent carboxyltransferase family protein [Betaproteobacteria bacterium]